MLEPLDTFISAVKSFILNDTVQTSSYSTFESVKSFVSSLKLEFIKSISEFSLCFLLHSILSNLYPSVGTSFIILFFSFSIKNFSVLLLLGNLALIVLIVTSCKFLVKYSLHVVSSVNT